MHRAVEQWHHPAEQRAGLQSPQILPRDLPERQPGRHPETGLQYPGLGEVEVGVDREHGLRLGLLPRDLPVRQPGRHRQAGQRAQGVGALDQSREGRKHLLEILPRHLLERRDVQGSHLENSAGYMGEMGVS